jgi:hypothetical protein
MSNRWFRRVLGLCPVLVALLWIAGVAHFRGITLTATEWLVIVAGAFSLQAIGRRMARPRPLPKLPPDSNPVTLAALAAAVVAVPAGLLGGLLELFVQSQHPSQTPLLLRTIWHAACAYAVCYCGFLLRLTAPGAKPPKA